MLKMDGVRGCSNAMAIGCHGERELRWNCFDGVLMQSDRSKVFACVALDEFFSRSNAWRSDKTTRRYLKPSDFDPYNFLWPSF